MASTEKTTERKEDSHRTSPVGRAALQEVVLDFPASPQASAPAALGPEGRWHPRWPYNQESVSAGDSALTGRPDLPEVTGCGQHWTRPLSGAGAHTQGGRSQQPPDNCAAPHPQETSSYPPPVS